MTTPGVGPAACASLSPTAGYWEQRAMRYAADGEGLRAVCSYGMPRFYNWAIQVTQRAALAPHLRLAPGTTVLDAGCGVGRWGRWVAARGAQVTGVDHSATMVAEAESRAAQDGVADRCRFAVADLATMDLGCQFDVAVCVTVVQHIVDPERKRAALRRLAAHVKPTGRLVLLEAAPSLPCAACDGPNFEARSFDAHRAWFRTLDLELDRVTGVDSTFLKRHVLPRYAHLPRWLAQPLLMLATAATLPADVFVARHLIDWSWHKVMVLRHPSR